MNFNQLQSKQKKFVTMVFLAFIGVYIAATSVFGVILNNDKTHAMQSHADRMDPTVTSTEYPEGDYTEVKVGTYVESIRNVSIADSAFEAVFYLWFSWEGEQDFSPGDKFQIVGGEISEKSVVSEHYDNGQNYQRYKVTATMDKYYNLTRFSLEDHMLNIYIEDTTRDASRLRFVADTEQTNISSRVNIPGFEVYDGIHSTVKPHSYKSTYSSPSAADGEDRVFSQYIVGIPINRIDVGFFLKIIIPYFLSVLLGLFSLFSHKTNADSLGLSGASFFGVVANAYVVSSLTPPNGGGFGLTDMINSVSLMSVIFVVVMSLYSLNKRSKLTDGEESHFLRAIDIAAFFGIGLGYTIFTVVLPLCAMLRP